MRTLKHYLIGVILVRCGGCELKPRVHGEDLARHQVILVRCGGCELKPDATEYAWFVWGNPRPLRRMRIETDALKRMEIAILGNPRPLRRMRIETCSMA